MRPRFNLVFLNVQNFHCDPLELEKKNILGYIFSSLLCIPFQCYFRAMSVGDLEGMAVIKLAR